MNKSKELTKNITEPIKNKSSAVLNKSKIETALNLLSEVSEKDIAELPAELVNEAFKRKAIEQTNILLENEIIKRNNIMDLLDNFLKGLNTINTRIAYKNGINFLLKYCRLKNINYLVIKKIEVTYFCNMIKEEKSSSLANLIINSNSSFYGFLVYNDIIKANPIFKMKRKKDDDTKDKFVPSKKQIDNVLKIADPLSKLAINIMLDTAVRISSLLTFKIKNGRYTCLSKTGKINGPCKVKASTSELQKLYDIKTKALSKRIDRLFFKVIKRKGGYSHSLRHYVTCKLYSETKDIYRVSKKLHHKGIQVTQTYLQSLNILD